MRKLEQSMSTHQAGLNKIDMDAPGRRTAAGVFNAYSAVIGRYKLLEREQEQELAQIGRAHV